MDSQLKKGLLEMLVLASLKYQDSYGYLINREICSVIDVSESTLYPILRRLEQQQLVRTYETTYNSRIRKYYQITREGIQKLEDTKSDFLELKKVYDYILR
ncbi:MAG: PadR family transcriptional regulator [Candidatus Izemoplasmatales bacterium]|nr:PadR family transcriptional regulator [Candidatus Izemoplasmatales bacterium]